MVPPWHFVYVPKSEIWYTQATFMNNEPIQEFMWRALKEIEPELKVQYSSAQWRVGPKYYRGSPNYKLKPGTTNLAPAWFEQGHDVSYIVL